MRKLTTIQKREKLNSIYAVDEKGNGGANHIYEIRPVNDNPDIIGEHHILATIEFQNGARKLPDSIAGVIDTDLLEIVRDRLKSFQSGEFSSRENARLISFDFHNLVKSPCRECL